MKFLDSIRDVDLYLLDQILKDRVTRNSVILDAGCGSGRNFRLFAESGYNVTGIDPNVNFISNLKLKYPEYKQRLTMATIEGFESETKFDFIICSAVLHFAKDHNHFEKMMRSLVKLLAPGGLLFIRMTTDIGINTDEIESENGVFALGDGTYRYLLTEKKITEITKEFPLKLYDPLKSVIVENVRSMGVIVFQKA